MLPEYPNTLGISVYISEDLCFLSSDLLKTEIHGWKVLQHQQNLNYLLFYAWSYQVFKENGRSGKTKN